MTGLLDSVSIDLEATPILSYAMAHNRVSVVSRLTIRDSPGAVRAATLRLHVEDADGPIGAAHEKLVDLDVGSPTVLTDVGFALDPAAMLQIEERRPGRIVATLEDGETTLARTYTDVQILAAHQWLARPLTLGLEMLAAFVMPNAPAIAVLMAEAADRLHRNTGSPSMQGYQSGPDRVDAIVRAVYEAMQARGIRYSSPPASWGEDGQRIRTPAEVLDGRVGTCLDTVVVMAAALEHAGIRPLLWVVDGHAFLGYWREEASLGSTVRTDVADIVNRVDLGRIRLVETTMVADDGDPAPFVASHRPPYAAWLTGDLERVLGVADVHQARHDRIFPLPARTRDADGTVRVTVYEPAVHAGAADPRAAGSGAGPSRNGRAAPPRVRQWKNALLDLSLRNRLVNFTDRARLPLAVPDTHLGTLEDTISGKVAVQLLPSDRIAAIHGERGVEHGRDLPPDQLAELLGRRMVHVDVPEASYDGRLRALAYRARTVREETGANNLYLAFGSLLWEVDERPLRSPLVLVPVHLTPGPRGGAYRLALDESGGSTPNYCLLEKLRHLHGLEIPGLSEPAEDGAGIDLDAALTATREAIAREGLRFRVEPTVDLAILQFAKFRLWKDLDEWEVLAANPLVRHLIEAPTDPFADPVPVPPEPDLDELAAACPVPGDSSQLAAVAEAADGRTFVLEGPPGTGKSQTITNLVTRAVATGRRVLFVAEKRAALDVVQKRLDEVGMGPFCLDLHDKGSRPAVVRDQIRRALEHTVEVDEQGLAVQRDDLRSSAAALARYARRLHEPNGANLSFYSARTAALALGTDVAALPVPEGFVRDTTPTALAAVRQVLARLPDVAEPARPRPGHPWAFVDGPDLPDVDAVQAAARELDAALAALPVDGPLGAAARAAHGPDDLAVLAALAGAPAVGLDVLDETRSARWDAAVGGLAHDVAAFVATPQPGLDRATPAALDLPLEDIAAAATTAAASGFFGRRKRLTAVRDRLAPALRPGVEVPPKQVPALAGALLQVQRSVRALAARTAAIPGLAVPPGWPLREDARQGLDAQVGWLRWVGSAVDPVQPDGGRAGFVGALRRFAADPTGGGGVASAAGVGRAAANVDRVAVARVDRAGVAASAFVTACGTTASALVVWAGDGGLVATWARTRGDRDVHVDGLPSLRRWFALVAHVEPLRASLEAARRALLCGRCDPDDAGRALERGIAEASLGERRRATGLDGFDAAVHQRGIARFTTSSGAVREHLRTAVPRDILAARTFDPAATGGQVGLLHRQLSRQRGGMRVRALMENFGELITTVMPCVLVSPDSVARFFPARAGLFDIVVFDEASQVRVADAVGAMGRGRSVVVVGDSKQMPPTSFAESAIGSAGGTDGGYGSDYGPDEDAGAPDVVEDEESILSECVQARVPSRRLSWHYRSQDESLIAFSNAQYYDGGLSSFPAPVSGGPDGGVDGHGVSLVRVDGWFHRSGRGALLRTNPIEAEAVVAEIRRRFDASPEVLPSLGVVTFNAQQRALIEGLLRDGGDPRLVAALDDASDGLFVKNLENVQGDERDVVLFSTGFSRNERGALPLNFGPLNRVGGERRLNVAITRARRQVVVFSSFDPAELRAEETSSTGIKHLRAYLDLAAHGMDALPKDSRRRPAPDRHREEIAAALRERGYAVATDVGLSEFTIDLSVARPDRPDRPVMAVLLDEPGWARRRTVGDRDGLPVDVLSRLLRWPAVERVWAPTWLADREAVLARLATAMDDAAAFEVPTVAGGGTGEAVPDGAIADGRARDGVVADGGRATVAVQDRAVADDLVGGDLATDVARRGAGTEGAVSRGTGTNGPRRGRQRWPTLDGDRDTSDFVPWRPDHLGTVATLDALPHPRAATAVATALGDAVEAEGPILLDRLAKLVAGGFGLGRVAEARRVAILRHLPAGSVPDEAEAVAWPAGLSPTGWRGYRRTPDGVDRPLETVPLREIVNAMAATVTASAGMAVADLRRETLAVFGGRRLTPNLTDRLDAALHLGVSASRLRVDATGTVTLDPPGTG